MALQYPPPQGYNHPNYPVRQGQQYPTNAPNQAPAPARMNIQLPTVSNAGYFIDQDFNPTQSHDHADDGDDANETPTPTSTEITVNIRTPLIIEGNDNIIAIEASSAASRIALAVVQGLKQICCGDNGSLPTVDEDGRPRPIKVDVEAETKVMGSNNILGEKAVMSSILGGGTTKDRVVGAMHGIRKRERVDSEEPEVEVKKNRRE